MVLPENTEELCSSVKYGRTMFFRKIFAKLFRKKKNLFSRILRKNLVVPYNISSGRTWFFRKKSSWFFRILRKNHVLPRACGGGVRRDPMMNKGPSTEKIKIFAIFSKSFHGSYNVIQGIWKCFLDLEKVFLLPRHPR